MAGTNYPPGTITSGRKTVTTSGTPVQLSATSVEGQVVAITAETDNTGVITVGGSDVVGALATRKGVPLAAGQTLSLNINNLTDVWIDTTVNTDGVTFIVTA